MIIKPFACVDEKTKLERLIYEMYLHAEKLNDTLYMDSIRIIGMQSMGPLFINSVIQCALYGIITAIMNRNEGSNVIEQELNEAESVRRRLVWLF